MSHTCSSLRVNATHCINARCSKEDRPLGAAGQILERGFYIVWGLVAIAPEADGNTAARDGQPVSARSLPQCLEQADAGGH